MAAARQAHLKLRDQETKPLAKQHPNLTLLITLDNGNIGAIPQGARLTCNMRFLPSVVNHTYLGLLALLLNFVALRAHQVTLIPLRILIGSVNMYYTIS